MLVLLALLALRRLVLLRHGAVVRRRVVVAEGGVQLVQPLPLDEEFTL